MHPLCLPQKQKLRELLQLQRSSVGVVQEVRVHKISETKDDHVVVDVQNEFVLNSTKKSSVSVE
jgi:hypothetical protein